MRVYRLKPLSICDTNSYIVASEQNNAVLELSKEVSEEVLCKAVTDAGYEYVK